MKPVQRARVVVVLHIPLHSHSHPVVLLLTSEPTEEQVSDFPSEVVMVDFHRNSKEEEVRYCNCHFQEEEEEVYRMCC